MKLFSDAFTIEADYFQIYIHDKNLDVSQLSYENWWSEKDNANLLSIKSNRQMAVIGTFRDNLVKVSCESFSSEPKISYAEQYDLINNFSMHISSKEIVVRGMFNEIINSKVYNINSIIVGVRVIYSGKNTIDAMGIEGDDCYKFQFWPVQNLFEVHTSFGSSTETK